MKDTIDSAVSQIDSPIKISDNVIVMEKELRNDSSHKDLITGI